MKKSLLFIVFLCVLLDLQAQKGYNLSSNKNLRTASYSYYAVDAGTGEVIGSSPQKSLVPASVMKLVTTAAALEVLGPQFRFNTILGYSGEIEKDSGILRGDLVIKGGCDPAFYSQYFTGHYQGTFEEWAEKIKESGIRRISGDLAIDISAMENSSIPGGWVWEDLGNYYGAGVTALSYSDNLYEIHLSSPSGGGKAADITYTNPEIEGLALENKVISSDANTDLSCVYGAPHSLQQEIVGTIPINRKDFVVKAAMPDPAVTAAETFKKILSSKGVLIDGIVKKETQPRQLVLLAEKSSPELSQLLVPLNQKSINLFAEQLLREIGRAQKNDPSLQPSIDALTEFWREKNICLDGFYPSDGSGLSRLCSLCPRTLVGILAYMYKGSNREIFFNSLPLAGASGTLEYSFRGTPLQNNLRAKTGSMKRVRSLAGVFTSRNGRKVIFAVILNNFDGNGTGKILEDFLINLYRNN